MRAPDEGPVPTRVRAINLVELAGLVGCSVNDLTGGLADASISDGCIATSAEHVAFEEVAPLSAIIEDDEPGAIDLAVISLAARPTVLDSAQRPKCLMMLGSMPVICHVLSQLHLGGIKRVVLVLGSQSALIRDVLGDLPISDALQITYVDLGDSYASGFARSLLAARGEVGDDPFLLCTPDHIFDKRIIRRLRSPASTPFPWDAVALVEAEPEAVSGTLPPTAVRVRLKRRIGPADPVRSPLGLEGRLEHIEEVAQIGKAIGPRMDGIEAGLYRCSSAIFTQMAELDAKGKYFTVANAMEALAAKGRLGAVFTCGLSWFAIETRDQLEETTREVVEHDGTARFPWQVHIARADSFSTAANFEASMFGGESLPDEPAPVVTDHRLVLAVGQDLQVVPPEGKASDGQAFSLLRATVRQEETSTLPELWAESSSRLHSLAEPLLATPAADADETDYPSEAPHEEPRRKEVDSYAESYEVLGSVAPMGSSAHAVTIAVAVPEEVQQTAYLFDVEPTVEGKGMTLAVPRQDLQAPTPVHPLLKGLSQVFTLPSNVQSVRLEYQPEPDDSLSEASYTSFTNSFSKRRGDASPFIKAEKSSRKSVRHEERALRLIVEKRVPPVGWLLLVCALLASSSGGAVVNWQAFSSKGNNLFLRTVWRGMCTSLFMAAAAMSHAEGRQGLLSLLRLTASQRALFLAAGLAIFCEKVLYAHTTLSHAVIFDSTAPLWLVISHLFRQSGDVPRRNIIGVLLGAIGTATCSIDPDYMKPGVWPWDLVAVFSGLSSCIYLSVAQKLRHTFSPSVFFCAVQIQLCAYMLIAAFLFDGVRPELSRNPDSGIFGWMNPGLPSRFFAQLWLAAVVDYLGNHAYIAVMKYVPALVIATAELFGPMVASGEGVLLRVEEVPGSWTVVGSVFNLLGGVLIAVEAQTQSTTVEL